MRSMYLPLASLAAFIGGTALHEALHYLTARLVGVRVTDFSLVPPAVEIEGDAEDYWRVAAAPVVFSVVLLPAVVVALPRQTLVGAIVVLAGYVGLVPRSPEDWRGFREVCGWRTG